MIRSLFKISGLLWVLMLISLPSSIQAIAGLKLSGQLGVDYEFHDYFTKAHPDSVAQNDFAFQRSISNHYLNTNITGPIVNDNFATFMVRTKLYGTYLRAEYVDSLSSNYIDPKLQGFYGQLTLFPTKRFPLQLYYSTKDEQYLKYESKNRSTKGSQRPQLKVVRHYKNESNIVGGSLKVKATDFITINSDISSKKSKLLRVFEFNEQNDLYIDFKPSTLIDTTDLDPFGLDRDAIWNISIHIINSDTITGVTVYLDMDPVFFEFPADLADASQSIYVPKLSDTTTGSAVLNFTLNYQVGQYNDLDSDNRNNWVEFIQDFTTAIHDVTLVPDTVNNINKTITWIPGNMQWLIMPMTQASPPDLNSEGDELSTSINYDNKENIINTVKISSGSRIDNFQNLSGDELSLSNDLAYKYNPEISLNMRTNNLSSNTILGNGKKQENSSFSNLTDVAYSVYGGLNTSLSHAFISMSSVEPGSDGSNLMNSIRGIASYPTGYKDHVVEGSMTLTLTNTEQALAFDTTYDDGTTTLDTIRETKSDSKTTAFKLDNSLSFYKYGIALTPDHSLKYQITSQSGSSSQKKIESASKLGGIITEHKYLGDVNIQLQHSYLRNIIEAGFNATSKISTIFDFKRKLSEDIELKAGYGYVITSYSGESQPDDTTGNVPMTKVDKPSESQTSYSFGTKMSVIEGAFVTASYRVTSQATSTTTIFGINLKLLLPYGIAFVSNIKNEARELEDSEQFKFYFDNSLSFSIRRIVLIFEYNYSKEERHGIPDTYNLWTGKITRSF